MAKKSFINDIDPLDTLIQGNKAPEEAAKETPQATDPTEKPAAPPAGYKYNPLYVETRSKRVQYLLTPSTVAKLKAKATAQGRSVNDLVNEILEAALKD